MEMPPLPEVELPKLPPVPQGGYFAFAMQQYAVAYAEKFALIYGESCARMAREQERERVLEIVRRWHTLRDASGRLSPVGEEISAAIRSRMSPESDPR